MLLLFINNYGRKTVKEKFKNEIEQQRELMVRSPNYIISVTL